MADYLTMLEVKGRIAGLKVAYIGDGNNVAHSLMFAGAQLGANVWIATPPDTSRTPTPSSGRRSAAPKTGASCTITHDPQIAAFDADVVYTDVWASMGQEAEAETRRKSFRAVSGERAAFRLRQAGRHLPALSAGASRRRGHRRSDRFAAFVRLSAGGEPAACAEGDHAGTDGRQAAEREAVREPALELVK